VLVREKQKSEEVNRLQEVIQKLLHNAGTKTKEEVRRVNILHTEKRFIEELMTSFLHCGITF
jgi:hypothetical protein